MSRTYTLMPKFKLIVEHLKAVRTLHEYVNGVGGLKKDMQDLSNRLQQDLNRDVFRPAGWLDLYTSEGVLYSSPRSSNPKSSDSEKSTWRPVKDDAICVEIYPAWPVEDDNDPYVNLYVPPSWKKRQQFISKLKPPKGFEQVSQYSEGEMDDLVSVIKLLPYEDYIGTGGAFDGPAFLDAFREAASSLVAMEETIDKILGSLG